MTQWHIQPVKLPDTPDAYDWALFDARSGDLVQSPLVSGGPERFPTRQDAIAATDRVISEGVA